MEKILLWILFSAGLFVLYVDGKALFQWSRWRLRKTGAGGPPPTRKSRTDMILQWAAAGLTALGVLCLLDGFFYEPYHLSVSRITLTSSKIPEGQTLRIAHLSDIHMEKRLRLHEELLDELRRFAPGIILLTGDYVNHSGAKEEFTRFAAALAEIAPVFAVDGNWDEAGVTRELFAQAGVNYIEARVETARAAGMDVALCGVPMNDEGKWRKLSRELSTDTLNLVLTHSPDLIPPVSGSGLADFYFCGHSHGGQIRLPFYGAIVTLCATGKKYEMGLYHEGGMAAYTNRGVGMEGGPAPRVRFLARPELALFTIKNPWRRPIRQ